VAEHCKGSERYGHLNDDRAEREQPDFSLGLCIHGSPNAQRHGSFQGSRIWRASKARTGLGAKLRAIRLAEFDVEDIPAILESLEADAERVGAAH